MKKLLALIILSLATASHGYEFITATLTVTNGSQTNLDSLTVSGSTRTGSTNRTSTTWQTNASPAITASNIFSQFGGWPVAGVLVKQTTPTNLTFAGVGLIASCTSNFASLSFATNTVGTNRYALMMPSWAYPTTLQASNASDLVTLLDKSTNAFGERAYLLTNFAGLTNNQTLGNKTLTNSTLRYGSISNMTILNGTNYGNAFSSPGTESGSEQFGSGATATATNTTAIGSTAQATDYGAIAIGSQSGADGAMSVSIGWDSTVASGASNAVAIGTGAAANEVNAIAIGYTAISEYLNSIAIGTGVAATRTNEIRLGGSQDVVIGGLLTAEKGATNLSLLGSNQLSGTLRVTSRAWTSLANGNNAGVPLGTNAMVDLSGATTIAYVCGFVAGDEDEVKEVRLSGAVTNFFANQSGVDPAAGNRIVTGTGGDVWSTNNPTYLGLRYKNSRWEIKWIR